MHAETLTAPDHIARAGAGRKYRNKGKGKGKKSKGRRRDKAPDADGDGSGGGAGYKSWNAYLCLHQDEVPRGIMSSKCAMRQVQIILQDLYTLPEVSFHNELYCACRLLQQGLHFTNLKECMHDMIRK